MRESIDTAAIDALFTRSRTQNGWLDQSVSDHQIQAIYDLVKYGPTSANCSPARFVFVKTAEAKRRLEPALSGGNLKKTITAPVTVIVAWDRKFFDKLPFLFPHGDARSWFTSNENVAHETAFRNSTLQAGYLILAARALGLDAGPMSGFDADVVNREFLAQSDWSVNFLINIGYGDPSLVYPRLPRLAFDDACAVL